MNCKHQKTISKSQSEKGFYRCEKKDINVSVAFCEQKDCKEPIIKNLDQFFKHKK